MDSTPITPAQRRALRARAHGLRPVVMIGNSGLTETVLAELDANLNSHELIKVKILDEERQEREALLEKMCAALGAAPVQHIGKILVLYRARQEKPEKPAPQPPRRAKPGKLAG